MTCGSSWHSLSSMRGGQSGETIRMRLSASGLSATRGARLLSLALLG